MNDAPTGLRELATILRSVSPNPKTVGRRAVEVNRALVERRKQLDPTDPLVDFIKAAQWLLCCLTVDGRVSATRYAMERATELAATHGLEATPQWLMSEADRLAPLPTFDSATLEKTAGEFESLADRLGGKASSGDTVELPTFSFSTNSAEITVGGKVFAGVDYEGAEALQKVVNAYPRSYGLSKDYSQPKRVIAKLPEDLQRHLESSNAGYFYLPAPMSDA